MLKIMLLIMLQLSNLSYPLPGLCLFIVDASADCIADIQNNGKFLGCMKNLMTGFQSLDPNDPRSMCTDIKKNMGCLTDFLKQCPEISSQAGTFAAVLPAVDQFKTLCGTPAAQKCPALSACTKNAGLLAQQAEMTPSGNSTPFSLIPVMVYSVCRVGKAHLKCLNDHRDACPDVVKEAEASMSNAMAMDKTSNVNYDMMKTFINVDCQAIPTDFPSNKCVREKLEGSGFVTCIMSVKQLSSKAQEKEQCKFYFDGKACIEEYVGKPCGSKNAKVVVDTAHWVIHDIPKECDMFVPPAQEKGHDPPENAQKCPALSACTKNAGLLAQQAEMTPSGNSTPFSLIPVMVYSVCRVGKAHLKCLNDHRDACPDVVKEAEASMSNDMAMDKTSNVNYDMMKTFINVDCQAIPTDFPSNKCVREKLEGSGFVTCIMSVKQLSSKAQEKEQCKFYFDGKACIEEYVGKPCGSKNAKVVVDTAHWVIHDIPKECDMFVPPAQEKGHDPPENGSSNIRVTLAALIMLIFAVFV